ncbi:hypothetical protein C2G38_2167772 [Gigaspora rosea]|uniref:Uncharacterized protein n=1 Tax=Gigaspora rosea TaxID=44941 RepID=A0A397VQE4_9GLOM|nr:hypothetical protein C2G38_2167772 [Gigaspora rosea]
MAKIATSFVNRYKLTPQTSLLQLSSYVEELAIKFSNSKTKGQAQKARDQAKRRFQELGLSKEQADILIPIQSPERHNITKNNFSPVEINGIAYDLASSAPTTVAGNSQLNLLRKELRKLGANYFITESTKIPFVTEETNQIQARKLILREINGYDCPEFFYLKKVQKRLNKYNTTKKIEVNHASRVYGDRNNSCCQYLRQLAYRHKIGYASSVEHYGIMNDRPNTPAPKQENSKVEDIIDLYGEIFDDEN